MSITVRKVTPTLAEARELCSLNRRIFEYPVDVFKPTDHWWIAYVGMRPAGLACLSLHRSDEAFLSLCGVLKSYRGQGVQRRLIGARVIWARKRGVKALVSYCHWDNPPSANNLWACGFKLYSPDNRWGDDDSLYFQMWL